MSAPASTVTTNTSLILGVRITDAQFLNPPPAILADMTTVYQTRDGNLYQSNGATLVAFGSGVVPFTTAQFMQLFNAAIAPTQAAIPTQLSQLTGTIQATQVVIAADGKSVEAEVAAIKSSIVPPGTSAPVLTSPPTYSLSAGVAMGSIMTITSGGVTNGSGGTPTTQYQLQGLDANGATTNIGSAISATVAAHPAISFLWPTHFGATGLRLSIVQVLIDPGAGNPRSTLLTSALTAVTTRTPPTYSGGTAPSLSPAGPVAPNVAINLANGVVAGGNTNVTFTDQFQFEPSGGSTYADIVGQTGASYPATTSQAGGSIRAMVTPLHSIQGPGTPTPTSNAVTISGSVGLVNTVAPHFANSMQQGVLNPIVDGTYTGGTLDPNCIDRIYCAEIPVTQTTGPNTPILTYGSLALGTASFTPQSDADFFALTGLPTPVGKTFSLDQLVTSNGGAPVQSLRSAGIVCGAQPTTLQLAVQISSVPLTMGAQYSAFTPVIATQFVGPITWSVTSTLPPGLAAINATTGTFPAGTAATTGTTQQTYQVTVQAIDTGNANATASRTFSVVISPAVSTITWLSQVYGAQDTSAWAGQGYELHGEGGDIDLANYKTGVNNRGMQATFDAAGVHGSGTIVGPTTLGVSDLRFGLITDPINPNRKVFYHAARASDPPTFFHLGRMTFVHPQTGGKALVKSGTTYWFAFELFLPSVRFANNGGGASTFNNIHNSNPSSVSTGPWETAGDLSGGDILPNPSVFIARDWQPVNNNGSAYWTGYDFISDNPTFGGSQTTDHLPQTWGSFGNGLPAAQWPRDQWVKVVVKYRGDPVAGGVLNPGADQIGLTGGAGIFQAWLTVGSTTTQVINLTGIGIGTNDAPAGFPLDYLQDGLDCQSGGGNGVWELRWSSQYTIDQGYTEPQVRAAMP